MELMILLVLAAAAGLLLWTWLASSMKAHLELRERALRQFRATVLESPALGTRFDGAAAEILDSQESHYQAGLLASNYVLTIRARMPDGAVFEFRSDPDNRPWVACRSRGEGHPVRVQAGT